MIVVDFKEPLTYIQQCVDKADKKMDIIIPYGVAKSYVRSYHIHFLMKMYDSLLEKGEC